MTTRPATERTKAELDLELDRQLEDTFPASDPLKITRGSQTGGFSPKKDLPEAPKARKIKGAPLPRAPASVGKKRR
jgi:hypothetical protein